MAIVKDSLGAFAALDVVLALFGFWTEVMLAVSRWLVAVYIDRRIWMVGRKFVVEVYYRLAIKLLSNIGSMLDYVVTSSPVHAPNKDC